MDQYELIEQQFGSQAQNYLNSQVHATGPDLEWLSQFVIHSKVLDILDLGCGAGHVSYLLAERFATSRVIACDLSVEMLDSVRAEATKRQLQNLTTQLGRAESLPFQDQSFDIVVSRYSAHHWPDVQQALKEIQRVLRPKGICVLIDIVAHENALYDTVLQAMEILRDSSHIRDYRQSEWLRMLTEATFSVSDILKWKLDMSYSEWVERINTPQERVQALKSLISSLSHDVAQYFALDKINTLSFDAVLMLIRKDSSKVDN